MSFILTAPYRVMSQNDIVKKLTDHQKRILQFAAGGLSNKEIATILKNNHQTVKNTLHVIYTKYRVNSKTQAVIEAIRRGDIDIEIAYQYIMARRREEDIY